jgi:hypothetical protein
MIYTLGHSTREWKEFLRILKHFDIELVVDVRHFPTSKKFPWFCKEEMEKELPKEGIEYVWLEALGGYRKGGYEKYMQSNEFKLGLEKLIDLSKKKRVVIVCAELKWWRCHRRFIADELVKRGIRVVHIWNENRIEEHEYGKYVERKVACDKLAEKLEKFAKAEKMIREIEDILEKEGSENLKTDFSFFDKLAEKYKEGSFELVKLLWKATELEKRLIALRILKLVAREDIERSLKLIENFSENAEDPDSIKSLLFYLFAFPFSVCFL